MQTLCAIMPELPITLYVPQTLVGVYQEAAHGMDAANNRVTVAADTWSNWIGAVDAAIPDLMAGLAAGARPAIDWQPWRWPLALLVVLMLINITALNMDWWRMKSEAQALRSSMLNIYKSVYPNETVILDPIAQMQQKIVTAQRGSGQAAPDDFIALAAALGEVWGEAWSNIGATAGNATAIAALEYRERSLFVRLKPGEAPTQQIKTALAKRDLTLTPVSEQSGMVVWQIGSAK